MFGFLAKAVGTVAKIGIKAVGGLVKSQLGLTAGPAQQIAMQAVEPPPAIIYPTPPIPIQAQLPYLSYAGGGLGGSAVNTFAPAKMSNASMSTAMTRAVGVKAKRAKPKKAAKKKKKKAGKLKFGSKAYRAKYLGH